MLISARIADLRGRIHGIAGRAERHQVTKLLLRLLRHLRHRQADGFRESLISTPAPPDTVITPSVLRAGYIFRVAVCAMSSISSELRARTTPNSAITASVTASSPAIDAVCDFAAFVPSSLRPTFCITIGLRRARRLERGDQARRLANALGIHRDHVHFGAFGSQPMHSPTVTSDSLPVMMHSEAPMPRLRASV